MGFVASTSTQILAPKLRTSTAQKALPEDPTVTEIAGAFFRQENIIGSTISKEAGMPDKYKDDPSFDAYSFFTEDEKLDEQFVTAAIMADNEDEIEATRRQIAREREDRDIMARGGATSFIVGLPVAVADPLSILSVGGVALNTYRAGKSILSGAAVTGSIVGIDTAVQEAALHTQQLTRTYGESAINISAGMLLGGVLGGTVAKMAESGADKSFMDAYEDVMNVEPKIADGINPTINELTKGATPDGGDSVGAAKVVGDFQISGKLARAIVKTIAWMDPLSRTLTSTIASSRRATVMLAENPYKMDGQTIQAAGSFAELHRAKLGISVEATSNIFKGYKKSGGKLNRRDFNKAIATAMRKGDSDIPEVKQAADVWRKELYDPLKQDMIDQDLLPEDVDITTANNYLNRVWNKEYIKYNSDAFILKVSNWLADKDIKLYEQAKSAAARVGQATGKEKKELQAIIDKAEFKKGRDFEAQDYQALASQIKQRILGSPDGRLPYDWQLGDGAPGGGVKNEGIAGVTGLRGPLRKRTFQIPDEMVEEFLENDIEALGALYVQNVAGDIEIVRMFGKEGGVQMTNVLQEITDEAERMMVGKSPKEQAKIQKQRDNDIRDIAGMRDRTRGVYGFSEDNIWTRIGRSSRDLNYLRLLGGVTVSSLPDVARVFMAEGFIKTFGSGLMPLIANTKQFKIAAAEMRRVGVGIDGYLSGSRSQLIADVGDYTQGGTAIERGLRAGAAQFGKLNVLDYWTAGVKQLHAVTMQTSIFDGLSKGKFDKRLERLGIDEQSAKDMWKQVKKHGVKENRVWITNAKNWDDPELERMWAAAVRKESDRVIIVPGQEKPLFMSTEMGKTIGQFRSFILSATQRVFIAGLQNQDHNAVGGFASLVGMGMFTYYLKQKIADREISDDPAVWVVEGIERSGALGVITEFSTTAEKISSGSVGLRPLLGISAPASRQVSRSIAESALGPTFGSLLTTTIAASNAITSEGEMTDSDIRAIRRIFPLQNLVYLRKGIDEVEKAVGDL